MRITDVDTSKRGALLVRLNSGTVISIATAPYGSLRKATAAQLADWELIADGTAVGWERLNEHLSLKGFLLTQVKLELAERLRAGIKRSTSSERSAKRATPARSRSRARVKA
ncbi:MAG: DUF2442 domain-containing protein [Flavobacteriales bacterium]|nr:DUF2442 domain-containing protein [Flavobacteriales bacterium]